MNPFDFVKSINETKIDLLEENPEDEKSYVPFVTNRAFSQFPDTLFHANEMNRLWLLSRTMQYKYYLHAVSKRKRWGKWHKKDEEELAKIKSVATYHEVSQKKAKDMLRLLTDAQIKEIQGFLDTREGGKA